MYVVSVASGYFKSKSGVASRSLLAFCYLASVSPPSLDVGWASEPEAQAGATPSPSSRRWWLVVGCRHGLVWWGSKRRAAREYTRVRAPSVLFRGGGIGALVSSIIR